jgi:hypothetical protein
MPAFQELFDDDDEVYAVVDSSNEGILYSKIKTLVTEFMVDGSYGRREIDDNIIEYSNKFNPGVVAAAARHGINYVDWIELKAPNDRLRIVYGNSERRAKGGSQQGTFIVGCTKIGFLMMMMMQYAVPGNEFSS